MICLKQLFSILFVWVLISTLFSPLQAREEYAEKTGQDCGYCHLDASGGSELTAAGERYQLSLETQDISPGSLFHLLIGYIHLLTAVFWFGTILYVHIILKPGYAAHGLPRGEVRVGLVSMLIMAITGMILVLMRFSSWSQMFESRTGTLFVIKISFFLLMIVSALFAVFYIGPRMRTHLQNAGAKRDKDMTADELMSYNGKNGNPAYIAYQGQIYDVSASGIWHNGIHFFRHPAGADLTEYISQAPHSEDRIFKMPKVGSLLDAETKKSKSSISRFFYIIAYFNLIIVLLILFVVAMIRWGL